MNLKKKFDPTGTPNSLEILTAELDSLDILALKRDGYLKRHLVNWGSDVSFAFDVVYEVAHEENNYLTKEENDEREDE